MTTEQADRIEAKLDIIYQMLRDWEEGWQEVEFDMDDDWEKELNAPEH